MPGYFWDLVFRVFQVPPRKDSFADFTRLRSICDVEVAACSMPLGLSHIYKRGKQIMVVDRTSCHHWVYLPIQVSSNIASTHHIDVLVIRLDSHNEPPLPTLKDCQLPCKISSGRIWYFSVYIATTNTVANSKHLQIIKVYPSCASDITILNVSTPNLPRLHIQAHTIDVSPFTTRFSPASCHPH